MRMLLVAMAFVLAPLPSFAGIDEVVDAHILPGYSAFADAASHLYETANQACTGNAVITAYHDAFDAWMGISHIQFGPIEDEGLSLAIAFWPDPRNRTGRALGRLISAEDPVVENTEAFKEVSVAAQGFFALERLLFEPPDNTEYACALVRAIAATLADNAELLSREWTDYADVLRGAGESGNQVYRSRLEAQRAFYTALSSGLEFVQDQRLGRPLGTFERPRPELAEARRSGRSLRNVRLGLLSLRDLAEKLSDGPIPQTQAAFGAAIDRADELDDPAFAGVSEPTSRIRVEALQQDVGEIREAIIREIGSSLGVSAGFNSLDGD